MSSELRKRPSSSSETEPSTPSSSPSAVTTPVINAADNAVGQTFLQKFLERAATASVLVGVFSAILMSNHFYVVIMVLVIQTMVFREITRVRYQGVKAREKKVPLFRVQNWYLYSITLLYMYGIPIIGHFKESLPGNLWQYFAQYHLWICFSLYVIGFCGIVLSLSKETFKYQFTQMAWSIFTLVLVVAQTSVFIYNIFDGLIWFLLPTALIIFNDIAAYAFGVTMGKKFIKQPLLALSPNKTWEGFIGAAISTIIFGIWIGNFLSKFKWLICPIPELQVIHIKELDCPIDPVFLPQTFDLPPQLVDLFHQSISHITIKPIIIHSFCFSLFASIIAPFGGFFASGMKRAYDVKDFDNLLPGHGGMTDRMDCQMIMGVCVYVHLRTFVKPPVILSTTTAILHAISLLSRDDQFLVRDKLNQLLQ